MPNLPDWGMELYLLFDDKFGETGGYNDWAELSEIDRNKWQEIAADFLKKFDPHFG